MAGGSEKKKKLTTKQRLGTLTKALSSPSLKKMKKTMTGNNGSVTMEGDDGTGMTAAAAATSAELESSSSSLLSLPSPSLPPPPPPSPSPSLLVPRALEPDRKAEDMKKRQDEKEKDENENEDEDEDERRGSEQTNIDGTVDEVDDKNDDDDDDDEVTAVVEATESKAADASLSASKDEGEGEGENGDKDVVNPTLSAAVSVDSLPEREQRASADKSKKEETDEKGDDDDDDEEEEARKDSSLSFLLPLSGTAEESTTNTTTATTTTAEAKAESKEVKKTQPVVAPALASEQTSTETMTEAQATDVGDESTTTKATTTATNKETETELVRLAKLSAAAAAPAPAPASASTLSARSYQPPSPYRPSSTFASRSSLRESFFEGSNASRSGTDDESDYPTIMTTAAVATRKKFPSPYKDKEKDKGKGKDIDMVALSVSIAEESVEAKKDVGDNGIGAATIASNAALHTPNEIMVETERDAKELSEATTLASKKEKHVPSDDDDDDCDVGALDSIMTAPPASSSSSPLSSPSPSPPPPLPPTVPTTTLPTPTPTLTFPPPTPPLTSVTSARTAAVAAALTAATSNLMPPEAIVPAILAAASAPALPSTSTTAEAVEAAELRAAAVQLDGGGALPPSVLSPVAVAAAVAAAVAVPPPPLDLPAPAAAQLSTLGANSGNDGSGGRYGNNGDEMGKYAAVATLAQGNEEEAALSEKKETDGSAYAVPTTTATAAAAAFLSSLAANACLLPHPPAAFDLSREKTEGASNASTSKIEAGREGEDDTEYVDEGKGGEEDGSAVKGETNAVVVSSGGGGATDPSASSSFPTPAPIALGHESVLPGPVRVALSALYHKSLNVAAAAAAAATATSSSAPSMSNDADRPPVSHWNHAKGELGDGDGGGGEGGGGRGAGAVATPVVAQSGIVRSSIPLVDNVPEMEDHRIRLGICAMDKKARSKPMGEILSRLDEALFEVVFFGDDMLLNDPVEEWPIVNVLIAFYSSGYPLEKAERYADLRRPFLLNDLPMQRVLKDRRRVYDLLEASGIDVPRHVYMSRDGYVSKGSGSGNGGNGGNEPELEEHDDHIEINGVVINKPFVEKPVDADDHNIAIYYPTSAGGGCKKLFRKVGDRSSEFYPDINEVRRDGSYIYEEFVETQGTDVKMYTVGPDYGHAEARKSPAVDGKVERNSDGKEVRFPVILTLREKEIARRIVLVFRQQVCGFDLLRVQEGDSLVSFVCDVNGWSFVKNSRKYYDDCAQILSEHMLAAVKPMALRGFSALDPMLTTQRDDDEYEVVDDPLLAAQSSRGAGGGEITPKKVRKKRKAGGVHRKTSAALQRVSRMLQGVGGGGGTTDESDSAAAASSAAVTPGGGGGGGIVTMPPSSLPSPLGSVEDGVYVYCNVTSAKPPMPAPPGGAAPLMPSLVLETAAATLEEGAAPVREIPHQLATNPPSMTASASSSVVGTDDASFSTLGDGAPANKVGFPGAVGGGGGGGGSGGGGGFDASSASASAAAAAAKKLAKKRGSQGFHQEELRCVIAIIRHGDRTPKQKLKVVMSEPGILRYFHDHTDNSRKDLKVKAKKPMEEFLETVKQMIAEKQREQAEAMNLMVIQEISAVTRGWDGTDGAVDPREADRRKRAARRATRLRLSAEDRDTLYKLRHMRDVLQRWKIGGLNRKLQIKPRSWEETTDADIGETVLRCTEVQLILKWGGNLTKLGERQSINLGQRMRQKLYPDAPGGGILRLHSTFRHDLKIKTSDEGRVMKTAAAFAKGLLELEGEIPPILVSLVHKEKNSHHMLDPSGNNEVKRELETCKETINDHLQRDFEVSETTVAEHEKIVGPRCLKSLHAALRKVGNPRRTLFAIHKTIGELLEQLDDMLDQMASEDENRVEGEEGLRFDHGSSEEALSGIKLYKGETLLELTERWRLLHKRLYDEEKDRFDLSRVPDVHDNVRFDMLHNPHLGLSGTLEKLYNLAKAMADCVVPQEYGMTIAEKRSIGVKMCRALLEKIKYDLIIARTDNEVDMRYMINMDYSADLAINTMGRRIRTRLYFTSESHLHTLMNVLRFASKSSSCYRNGPLLSKRGMELSNNTPELCYLTQVVMRLFEDPKRPPSDPRRFRVEILFSPGATATPLHMAEMDRDSDATRFETTKLEMISKDGLTCKEVEDYFTESIREGKTEEDDDEDLVSASNSKKDEKKKKKKEGEEKKGKNKEASNNEVIAAPPQVPEEEQAEATPMDCNNPVVAGGGHFIEMDGSHKNPGEKSSDAPETMASVVEEKPEDISIDMSKNDEAVEENMLGIASCPRGFESLAENIAVDDGTTDDGTVIRPLDEVVSARGVVAVVEEGGEDGDDDASLLADDKKLRRLEQALARRYFWTSVAVVSFTVGIGCLALAFGSRKRNGPSRRWTQR